MCVILPLRPFSSTEWIIDYWVSDVIQSVTVNQRGGCLTHWQLVAWVDLRTRQKVFQVSLLLMVRWRHEYSLGHEWVWGSSSESTSRVQGTSGSEAGAEKAQAWGKSGQKIVVARYVMIRAKYWLKRLNIHVTSHLIYSSSLLSTLSLTSNSYVHLAYGPPASWNALNVWSTNPLRSLTMGMGSTLC